MRERTVVLPCRASRYSRMTAGFAGAPSRPPWRRYQFAPDAFALRAAGSPIDPVAPAPRSFFAFALGGIAQETRSARAAPCHVRPPPYESGPRAIGGSHAN